jgi:hypothetical protein
MVRSLNKYISCFLFLVSGLCYSQLPKDAEDQFRPKDYKDKESFKHYGKRRKAVAKWQINQLKNGALVVRLHNNKLLIESLKKMGKADLATQKEYENYAFNKNLVKAFKSCYTFSRVYFFFGDDTDTLWNGARSGIFLDTNLTADNTIVMNENFYMLLEKDDIYNSSIGFVKEDTARFIKEKGTVIGHEAYPIMKNKYGHQVKAPFPMSSGSYAEDPGSEYTYKAVGDKVVPIFTPKAYRVNRMCSYAKNLSNRLNRFYMENKDYEVKDPNIKPFLY